MASKNLKPEVKGSSFMNCWSHTSCCCVSRFACEEDHSDSYNLLMFLYKKMTGNIVGYSCDMFDILAVLFIYYWKNGDTVK